MGTKGKDERGASIREAEASNPLPWERQPGESIQAFTRFITYRDIDPSERSMVKVAGICEISDTLVNRWGKRWSWLKRALAYDMWMLELSDKLGKRAVLGHRGQLVRFGSLSLSKAERTVAKLDETKLTVDDAVNLASVGAKLAAQGLGVMGGETKAERDPGANVSVNFNSLGWANNNQTEQNKVLVLAREQVIAAGDSASAPAQLPERRINCPSGKGKG